MKGMNMENIMHMNYWKNKKQLFYFVSNSDVSDDSDDTL